MNYRQEYEKWLASPALSEDERNELKAIANDEKEIENRFYGPLEFGTAGLRGTMYVGLHNLNRHVIRWATQGFANVIRAEGEEAMKKGVAICMDCRNHSMEFARAAACVMAGNGITVKLFESLRPTPELSFAVREYGCEAGINVTASHNPKEYNGYKVYGEDGAQLGPEAAAGVTSFIRATPYTACVLMDMEEAKAKGLLHIIGNKEVDDDYIAQVKTLCVNPEMLAREGGSLSIVYTPLHGSGNVPVRRILKEVGITHVSEVKEQELPDPNFQYGTPKFKTPSGKFEFSSEAVGAAGLNPVIGWIPRKVTPKDGEFAIVGGKQGIHSHTMTQNIACLNAISREYHMERLWISAQDAEDLGVQTGDTVEVASSEHVGQVEARVTQRLKPGVVFLPTHYGGSSPYQSRAYEFGLNMTDFVPFHMEPGTGATMSQEVAVTVRKVEA